MARTTTRKPGDQGGGGKAEREWGGRLGTVAGGAPALAHLFPAALKGAPTVLSAAGQPEWGQRKPALALEVPAASHGAISLVQLVGCGESESRQQTPAPNGEKGRRGCGQGEGRLKENLEMGGLRAFEGKKGYGCPRGVGSAERAPGGSRRKRVSEEAGRMSAGPFPGEGRGRGWAGSGAASG